MTEDRYMISLKELFRGQRFGGIIKQNFSKMGISKLEKMLPVELPGN